MQGQAMGPVRFWITGLWMKFGVWLLGWNYVLFMMDPSRENTIGVMFTFEERTAEGVGKYWEGEMEKRAILCGKAG